MSPTSVGRVEKFFQAIGTNNRIHANRRGHSPVQTLQNDKVSPGLKGRIVNLYGINTRQNRRIGSQPPQQGIHL